MTVMINLQPSVAVSEGTLRLDGTIYKFRCEWNSVTERWYLSLASQDLVLRGLPLTAGKNILAPHGVRDVLGELWVIDSSGRYEDPTFDGWGGRWILEYTTRDEL